MAQVTHFFAGANSGAGFQNLFPELLDLETAHDMMVLKGGPGVGKNTFMREIGRCMEQAGTTVEYLWCSGDPDSLDGVVLPELRCAVVDGTAPHVVEPKYPAAVDRYVDLGRFYDLTGAKTVADAVREQTKACQRSYARACHSLRAARLLELDGVAEAGRCLDRGRLDRRISGIMNRELRKTGTEQGRVTRRFLGTLTHQGYVWRFDTVDALCSRVYELADSWERAGEVLDRLCRTACQRKWDVIACVSPEDPDRIEHLLIPGLGLAFVTSRPGMEYGKKPYRRIRVDAMEEPADRAKLKFQSKMTALLREEAVAALRETKAGHDALEAALHPYVDFDSVQALAAIEAGRLLSYMS